MNLHGTILRGIGINALLFPTVTAFLEVDHNGTIAENTFVDKSLHQVDETVFLRGRDAIPDDAKAKLSRLEERLGGVKPGNTHLDARSGRVASIELRQPLLPGSGDGNTLLWSVGFVGDDTGVRSSLTDEEWSNLGVQAVKDWLIYHSEDLNIDATNELFSGRTSLFDSSDAPSQNVRTGIHGDGDMIQISISRMYKGIPVVGSRASATIKLGNLINVGFEQWGDLPPNFSVEPSITAEEAINKVATHSGQVLTDGETCTPELQILTLAKGAVVSPSKGRVRQNSRFGNGYKHALVWRVCPQFEGQSIEMMEGLVDANTGKVYSFKDTVDYFQATGDVYPVSNDGNGNDGILQSKWPMPFMQVGSEITDTGGNYNAGGSKTATLYGPYVNMADNCGSDSLTQTDKIDWGGSGGTDCTTPGIGGSGNTHSSRTGFYELNKIKEIARSQLPSNTWLKGRLTANMNIKNTCNAFWNGSTVNFYRYGGGCRNTGEIAAIFDHEWGHGMDANDVAGGIASPSGEGIADLYSALRLGDSCIGRGFFTSQQCSGDTNPCLQCTGVRDIDYEKRKNGTPSTYAWANKNCGSSVHCKGYVYSEAVWSLYKRHLQSPPYNYDDNTALEIVMRLTFIAAGNVKTWYSGCSSTTSCQYGGCGSNSGYKAYIAADDDNGNLNDGTPHMLAIFNAFNDQQIACNTPTVKDSGCSGTPVLAPDVVVSADDTSANVTWTSVSGATNYQVFRTEGVKGCGQGKVLLATVPSASPLAFTDVGLMNGREYYYIVIPKGSNAACFGRSSACATVVPSAYVAPTTSSPTNNPTSGQPSASPTTSPPVTLSPSKLPTPLPTLQPVSSTSKPTSKPTTCIAKRMPCPSDPKLCCSGKCSKGKCA